jgi:hypothetical protein
MVACTASASVLSGMKTTGPQPSPLDAYLLVGWRACTALICQRQVQRRLALKTELPKSSLGNQVGLQAGCVMSPDFVRS